MLRHHASNVPFAPRVARFTFEWGRFFLPATNRLIRLIVSLVYDVWCWDLGKGDSRLIPGLRVNREELERRTRCFLSSPSSFLFLEESRKNLEERIWRNTRLVTYSNSLEDVETVPRGSGSSPRIAFAISPVKESACIRKAKPEPVIRRPEGQAAENENWLNFVKFGSNYFWYPTRGRNCVRLKQERARQRGVIIR